MEKEASSRISDRVALMITAPASNSGKTAITCGLLAAMMKRGKKTCAFKCGPDYIDPMFHRSVLGVESRNLDVFLAGEDGVREVFKAGSSGMDAVICEGVMGYYDGMSRVNAEEDEDPARGSAWHLSTMLDIPALLVVRPKGSALTLAAVIRGLAEFRSPSNIAGVIFNDCSRSYYESYAEIIEEESGIPVLGYLPHMEEAGFDSRHLGLMTASEIDDLKERIDRISSKMEETVRMDRLISIATRKGPSPETEDPQRALKGSERGEADASGRSVRIAVARDEAFCFIYEETLEALRLAGAEPVPFSPIHDRSLPENTDGLYLPGGYPELYAESLAKNGAMRRQIRELVLGGLPTLAECGGFLYLCDQIADDKSEMWPMTGVLQGLAKNAGRLVRFGYGHIVPEEDSMLFRSGEEIPVHEFHYWDSTDNGSDLELVKFRDGSRWRFGFCSDSLYAGFPHLYMGGGSRLAKRFVAAAEAYFGRE